MPEPPERTARCSTRTTTARRLTVLRRITVIVITHEHQIAEYGSRIISFRDGRIVSDAPNALSRQASEELEQLPPPVSEVA
jgi:putative ABC transport system ATP-binding protein